MKVKNIEVHPVMDHELSLSGESRSVDQMESSRSDAILAKEIVDGDIRAWDQFFYRYSPWAYRFAYYHLNRNHADAEDLCSDIMMTAAQSIKNYDASRGRLDAWLLGIARNRLSFFYKKSGSGKSVSLEIIDEQSDREDDYLSMITDEIATRDAVNKALSILPEHHASALVGKYVEGYSTEELARIENITPKAMESLLTRARNSFRNILIGLLSIDGRGR